MEFLGQRACFRSLLVPKQENGRTERLYGNRTYVTYGYDASGVLTKISHYVFSYPSDTLIASNGYEYDAAGNVTRMVLDDELGAGKTGDATITYEYDSLYRLTKEYCNPAVGSQRTKYTNQFWFDSVGNRTKLRYTDPWSQTWDSEYSYSARNELTAYSDGVSGMSWELYYDARGNLTRKWDTENESRYEEEYVYTDYSWDSRDLLTKVHIFDDSYEYIDKTVEYKYDLMGRRVAKRVDAGAWRWYFYDGLKVIAEGRGGKAMGKCTSRSLIQRTQPRAAVPPFFALGGSLGLGQASRRKCLSGQDRARNAAAFGVRPLSSSRPKPAVSAATPISRMARRHTGSHKFLLTFTRMWKRNTA